MDGLIYQVDEEINHAIRNPLCQVVKRLYLKMTGLCITFPFLPANRSWEIIHPKGAS
jgi:hypothetical protein